MTPAPVDRRNPARTVADRPAPGPTAPRTPRAGDDVDAWLGPREERFFGSGYRSVRTALRDVAVGPGAEAGTTVLTARAQVDPGTRWSSKGARAQTPHLSTPDLLRLAERVARTLLAARHPDDPGVAAGAWVAEVGVSAGRVPVEDGLDDLPVRADARTDDAGRLVADVAVASMTARVVVVAPAPGSGTENRPAAAGTGLALPEMRALVVSGVRLLPSAPPAARAEVVLDDPADPAPLELVDHLVAALQLGQVLLYTLDGIDRAASSTLWMRRTRVTRQGPPRPAAVRTPVRTELSDARLLLLDGRTWRCADVVSACDGVTVVCSVAHVVSDTSADVSTAGGRA